MCKHKRSEEATVAREEKRLRRRRIRSLIFASSFHDLERNETVSRISRLDLLSLAGSEVLVSDVPDVEKGEVLVDSREQGSFQHRRKREGG